MTNGHIWPLFCIFFNLLSFFPGPILSLNQQEKLCHQKQEQALA